MTKNIYELLQAIIPELAQQDLPDDLENYDLFDEWMNETLYLWHYIEMKEFFNHDIEENYFLQQKQADCAEIDQKISSAVDVLLEQQNDHVDVLSETDEIFFNVLCEVAEQHDLSLLVLIKENPSWMFLPKQSETQLDAIVEAFNRAFNVDGDLMLTHA